MSSNKDDKAKKEKQAKALAELRKEQSVNFKVLSDTNEKSGQIYLTRCASITRIHAAAKAKKLLPLIKPVLFHEYKVKHSSAVKMMAVHRYWASKSDGEKAVFCRLFSDDNKSILECVTRLALNRMDGKKDTGRFVDIDISERTVNVELDGPQEFIDLATIPEIPFKTLIFGNPKTASKRKGKKLEQAETKIRDQAVIFRDIVVKYLPDKYVELMASRKDWDSVFTDLSDSSSESPGSADAVDNRASDVPLDVQGDIHANDGTTAESIPENGDIPTLVPDAVDDPGSKVLEVAEETVDEADVESTVIGSVDEAAEEAVVEVVEAVEAVEPADADDADVVEADVEAVDAEKSSKDLEDLFSLDFDIDGNSDGLDDSDFDIMEVPMVADAVETETDVKVKKTRSARNIAPSNGTHGNTPYAGGAAR